jgi:FkbM family methyltransferase
MKLHVTRDDWQSRRWVTNLNSLLTRLSPEDRYLCVAGIPGPTLELRSGALPREMARGTGVTDYIPLVAEVSGLDCDKLRDLSRKIAHEYRFIEVLRKFGAITCDLRSRLILLEDYRRAFIHRLRGISSNSNVATKIREIRLCVQNKIINIAYPADMVSVGLIWEVFAQEIYSMEVPVERIYDFGANIGLTALYFHLLNPSAELICIEPLSENFQLLERNLKQNNIDGRLIQAAAGTTEGPGTLFFSGQSHAIPSLHAEQPNARQVSVIPFDKIVNGNNYGLKIDIEGAEGDLSEFPSIIENAKWIVGELHYLGESEHDSRVDKFFDIVKDNFFVSKSRPIAYFVGDDVMICESFKASKHKRNAE